MNIKRIKHILVAFILVALILGGISIQTMASSDKLVFGMIVKWVGTPFINAFIQGAQQKADELGVELIIQDAQADSLKIIELIDIFRNSDGYCVISVGSNDYYGFWFYMNDDIIVII